ncbi:hypothetical protein DCS_03203 [Drechmeria coniospora]|uniref:Uncharacterized protein n=1 Tax=Drechmeria coniospora TaxID=98403 RepID=A0A151GY74_DRECN|nr:hypothetical protein DCS_03203 [Drechmeria coniospora]KYK62058.1 hypothetical protein DCS_03203 [Drechmeria coniospora]ODA81296.1 hypothetical protein RJ55_04261 [Drechmeria coniospora]
MKFTSAIAAIALGLASVSVASPTPDDGFTVDPRDNILEPRKGCSGQRTNEDKCSGRRLGPQNSFHNCKNRDGKCCAKNKDGSGGLDASRGVGREDCGYCFTGKCKA